MIIQGMRQIRTDNVWKRTFVQDGVTVTGDFEDSGSPISGERLNS